MSDEPKRPYYVPRSQRNRPIVLQMLAIIVKPLRVNDDGTTTHQIIATKPPTSRAAKQVIDN